MNKYLSIMKRSLWILLGFSIFSFLLSIIYCYTNISYKTISTLLLVFSLVFFLLLGYFGGRKQENKGFIFGMKYGVIICLFFYLIGGLLFEFTISFYKIAYYLILILACMFGSIIGINRKK